MTNKFCRATELEKNNGMNGKGQELWIKMKFNKVLIDRFRFHYRC